MPIDLPWGGWLNGSRWREIAASADQQKTHDLLNQMVEADDATKRMAIAQKARTQLSTSNRVNLIDSRFLLQNEAGDVMLSPRFLADLERSDAKLFIAHLDDEGLAFIWYLFPYLPTNYQIEILGRFRNHEKWVMRWWDIVMRLTDDHVDAVIPWLGVDDDHIGYMVGLWLWGGHQKTTEALLIGNTSHIIKRRLIFSAHSTYSGTLTTLIQVLKSEALLSPEELKDLVLRFLPSSAGLAPKLISLMEP